jgi:hypothetical protein
MLATISPEPSGSFTVEKCKNENIQFYNFACGSVCVWNLFSDIKAGTQTTIVREQDAEENIWTKEGLSDGRVEKTA